MLDMDSSESPVHGQQEGSAYNGHFESVCYHPLLLFNDHGDCVAAKLGVGARIETGTPRSQPPVLHRPTA